MLVLLIVVLRFEFPVRSVKRNVVIWKIVVPHQTVIHTLSLVLLYELCVWVKRMLTKKLLILQANNSRAKQTFERSSSSLFSSHIHSVFQILANHLNMIIVLEN